MILFHKDYGFFYIDVCMENPSHQSNSSSSSSSEDEDIKSKVTRVFKKKIGCVIAPVIKRLIH